MNSPSKQHAEKLLGEIEEWVNDPLNERLMFQEPLAMLSELSANREYNIGEVLSSLTGLSNWFASKSVLDMYAGKGSQLMCDSFWCDFYYNTVMKSSFENRKQKKPPFLARALGARHLNQPKPTIMFNDQGLLLAKAFALGLVEEGEAIGRSSFVGLREGWFYGMEKNYLTPFVLSVFAKWKNIPLSNEEFPFVVADGYAGLLQNLTADTEEIRSAINDACDFHLSRSKDHDDETTYEFADPVYAVFPVEILFVLHIRKIMGLSNPAVDHWLMNTPIARLAEGNGSLSASLKPIFENMKEILRVRGYVK